MGRWDDGKGGLAHCEGIGQTHRRGAVGAARSTTYLCSALPRIGRRVGADPLSFGARFGSNAERHLARSIEPRWTLRLEESQVSETSEAPIGSGRNSDYQSSSGPVCIMSPSVPVGALRSRTLWRSGLTAPHRQPPASGLPHYGIPRCRRLA